MNEQQGFDFSLKAEVLKGIYADKPLDGEKGIFAPLLKYFLESVLERVLNAHL